MEKSNIEKQVIDEINLRRQLRGESRETIIGLAKKSGVTYGCLYRWFREERSISSATLEKLASALGKKVILVDKNALSI